MTTETSWAIREANGDDCDRSLALVNRAFDGSPFSVDGRDLWRWLFLDHPAGPASFAVADTGQQLVGQYATVPVRLQHAGSVVSALMSVQTATDPAFQRQGILSALANWLYGRTQEKAPIVFGFPNPAVAPTRYGRLGWVELRPFPLLGRPIVGLPLERPTRNRITTFDSFGSWADELWQGLAPDLGTCAIRDATYLNWRFRDSPFSYRFYALERDGAIVAFAVLGFTNGRGRRVAYIMELMARADDSSAARALIARCVHASSAEGARAIATIATRRHPHRTAFLRAGLVPLPKSLRRSFSFGVRQNGPGVVPNELFHIDDWYLSPADLDYV